MGSLQGNFVVRRRADRVDVDRHVFGERPDFVDKHFSQRNVSERTGLDFVGGVDQNVAGKRGDVVSGQPLATTATRH